MRYKTVPEPRTVEELRSIRGTVPLVPGSEEDCCTRIVSRTSVAGRDAAREWLTFLQALGLVAESGAGFHRTREEAADLDRRFLDGVFGAREVATIVRQDGPIDAEGVFARFQADIPGWERHRHHDWEAEWLERTDRLLRWAVRFDILERVESGEFRPAGA